MRTWSVACVLAAAAAVVFAIVAPAGGEPRCFGAAARDPDEPCREERSVAVVPGPLEARELPNAPCEPVERGLHLRVCGFGASPTEAVGTVALVGDSHASHWRAAVDVVARAKGWRGLSIMRTSCPLSKAVRDLTEPKRSGCTRWRTEVFRWVARHPEVTTVFVGALSGGSGVVPRPGQGRFAAAVDGYLEAWRALPASVRQIVVIRDTPKARRTTSACIGQAIARRQPAGVACAVPRRQALDPDPAAAAARPRSPRVQTVDLTRFFCDRRACYPVIGGALVLRDQNHMTAVFASTLGPYLLREVEGLMALWR